MPSLADRREAVRAVLAALRDLATGFARTLAEPQRAIADRRDRAIEDDHTPDRAAVLASLAGVGVFACPGCGQEWPCQPWTDAQERRTTRHQQRTAR